MSKPLPALLDAFHMAILSRDTAAIAPAIQPHPRLSAEQQLAIYTEGYRLRLTQAIRSDYPALLAYLGEDAFDALALEYIESQAPQGFNLDRYPHPFAGFARARAQDGFAAELATLEGTIAELFMAPESPPLTAAALAEYTPDAFAHLRLTPRAASRLLRLKFPAEAAMAAWREGAYPARPEPAEEILYVVRHDNEVRRHLLAPAEYLILSHITAGESVGAALDNAAQEQPGWLKDSAANLETWMARWLHNGFFQGAPLDGFFFHPLQKRWKAA